MRRISAAAAVAVVGLIVLAVAVAVVGARSKRHITGTNEVRPFVWSVEIPAGATACQPHETVPDGSAGVRLRIGTFDVPGPRLEVSVKGAGRGELPAGFKQGDVVVAIPEVRGDRVDTEVCVANHGSDRVALAGENFDATLAATIGGVPQPGRARIEYLQPRTQSWWALTPTLAKRLATVRAALPGGAALYVWGLLMLAVVAGSLALVVREGRD